MCRNSSFKGSHISSYVHIHGSIVQKALAFTACTLDPFEEQERVEEEEEDE